MRKTYTVSDKVSQYNRFGSSRVKITLTFQCDNLPYFINFTIKAFEFIFHVLLHVQIWQTPKTLSSILANNDSYNFPSSYEIVTTAVITTSMTAQYHNNPM